MNKTDSINRGECKTIFLKALNKSDLTISYNKKKIKPVAKPIIKKVEPKLNYDLIPSLEEIFMKFYTH